MKKNKVLKIVLIVLGALVALLAAAVLGVLFYLHSMAAGIPETLPDAPADSRKHGMGIGLSVCAAIIKAHGGEIRAESRPGEGTTIRFWLKTEEIELEDAEDEQ